MFCEAEALDRAQEKLINNQLDELYMDYDNDKKKDEIIEQQDDLIAVLVETLKYYANRNTYTKLGPDSICLDNGQRAQNTLILAAEVEGDEPAHKGWIDDITLAKGFKFIEMGGTK